MPSFQELDQPVRNVQEIPQRIELIREALLTVGEEGDASLRALLYEQLATYLTQSPQGARSENLEQAIAYYKQALDTFTRQTHADAWATVQNNLGGAYLNRILGDRADNIERARECFEQALEVVQRAANPYAWAAIENNLGRTYIDRVVGGRAENVNTAVRLLSQALEIRTQETYPTEWAETQSNLAQAYQDQGHLPAAVEHFNEALKVLTVKRHPEQWAHIQQQLGFICAENNSFQDAINYFQEALKTHTFEEYPKECALDHYALGLAYCDLQGDRASNLEYAIEHFRQALNGQTDAGLLADIQASLAKIYKFRVRGERADNLEEARRWAFYAQRVHTRDAHPEDWAREQILLGEIYQERIVGDASDNVNQAIGHYQHALEVYTPNAYPYEWMVAQIDLGNAYMGRTDGEPADNVEKAIAYFESSLSVCAPQTYRDQWARTHHNLGVAYSKRIRGERGQNLEDAIAHYHEALTVRTKEAHPEEWANTQNNLAFAYSERIRGERAENLQQAVARYDFVLEVRTLDRFPADFQETQYHLGRLLFDECEWARALAAFRAAFDAERVLLGEAYTEVGRRTTTARTAPLYACAAYALAKLDMPGEALAQLEQGMTRLMSRALALDALDMSVLSPTDRESVQGLREEIRALNARRRPRDEPGAGLELRVTFGPKGDVIASYDDIRTLDGISLDQAHLRLNKTIERIRQDNPNFLREEMSLREILAVIPKDAALVVPVITSKGTAALVVPAGIQSVSSDEVLWLQFTDENLRTLLLDNESGWLLKYLSADTDGKAWLDKIQTTGRLLWDELIGPIAEHLAGHDVRHVLLMPQGGVGLLPLHAAWREVKGKPRYLLDDYTISYVASSYALHTSEDRLQEPQRQARTLLAAANPTGDLPFTEPEGERVASLFGEDKSTLLLGNNATTGAVKQGLTSSYLHFACHGFYKWRDPMRSGLVLANGEALTLSQIIGQLNLSANRLVTLSACETGITDITQSPDEYLGLPAGFLQAGAPAVVSTLWAVNDLSTMLLTERFYRYHFAGLELPEALRRAQLWLRDVPARALAAHFDAERRKSDSERTMPYEQASAAWRRFVSMMPEARPFVHPYYWAAFTFSGV